MADSEEFRKKIYNEVSKIIDIDYIKPAWDKAKSFQYKIAKLQNTNSYVIFMHKGFTLTYPARDALKISTDMDEDNFDIKHLVSKLPLQTHTIKTSFYKSYQSKEHPPQTTENIYEAIFENHEKAKNACEWIKERDLVIKAYEEDAYDVL